MSLESDVLSQEPKESVSAETMNRLCLLFGTELAAHVGALASTLPCSQSVLHLLTHSMMERYASIVAEVFTDENLSEGQVQQLARAANLAIVREIKKITS